MIANTQTRVSMWACSAMLLAVFLGRAAYIWALGVDVPFWDQWEAEGGTLLKPWMEGSLTLADLIRPWNEHRIFFTRLTSILLFEINGGHWGNLQGAYFNAGVYAVTTALLARFVMGADCPTRHKLAVLGALLLIALLPFGWENFLIGFQSQFYYMTFFAMLGLGLASHGKDGLLSCIGICLIAMASTFTMASGLILAPAMFVVLGARWLNGKFGTARLLVTGALLIAIAGAAYWSIPVIPHHLALKTTSLRELSAAGALVASWPSNWPLLGTFIIWTPSIVGAFMVLTKRWDGRVDFLMLGLAAWVGAQGLGIAYSRGNGMTLITPRYTELLACGLIAQTWFAMRLMRMAASSRPQVKLIAALPVLLLAVAVLHGFVLRTPGDMAEARLRHAQMLMQQAHVAAYVRNHDPRQLAQPQPYVPFPDSIRLQAILDDPHLRPALIGAH